MDFKKPSNQTLLKGKMNKEEQKKSHLFYFTELQQKWKEIRPRDQNHVLVGDLNLRSQAH